VGRLCRATLSGSGLTTAAFYDRFCAGDFDTRFGVRWATYFEATLARPASDTVRRLIRLRSYAASTCSSPTNNSPSDT
jgi:hypothetical protein